ncbi:peptidyl-tRNA hydrolase [Citrus sinensis]|uniref:Peptidyl-tRNA hydrolase n=1 Tax=Citrus sinensis TaxID=2711 RepID=A0ACB8LYJ3_CITSI|nr:peptidyl-tRNA hydrolase [Citrus sinensis]
MKFANTLTASISAVRFPNIHHSIRFPLKHSPLCCWGRRTRMSRSPSNSTIRNFSSSISNEESLVSPKPKQQQQHPWLIVGLGNPGKQYNGTRHNVGFEMVDAIAEAEGISMSSVNFKAHFGKGFIGNVPVMLAKPQTFMNASGQSVGSIVSYYKIPLKQVLVRQNIFILFYRYSMT